MFDTHAYQSAVYSQTASNLSGLTKTLAQVTTYLWAECRRLGGSGSDYIAKHPIVKLYLHQMAHLAGINSDLLGDGWEECYRTCQIRATMYEGLSDDAEVQRLVAHTTGIFRDKLGREGRPCTCPLPSEGLSDGGDAYDKDEMEALKCETCKEAGERAIEFLLEEVAHD